MIGEGRCIHPRFRLEKGFGLLRHRIAAVILAAGGSARFGKPKQVHLYAGEPLVRRAVHAALHAGSDEVVVVLGAHAEAIAQAVDQNPRVRTVVNRDWNTGLASSITVGLSVIAEGTDGILITLADQPLVDSAALKRIIEKFDDTRRIVASSYAWTIGVPALFGSEHIDELRLLTGDHGAGRWIRARLPDVTIVPIDAAATDVDTPADAARLEEL